MTVQVNETVTEVVEVPGVPSQVLVIEAASPQVVELIVSGPQGPKGDTGSSGGQPVPVTQTFSIPSNTWIMAHSFPYYPAVITRDMSGNVIDGDVSYPDGTHVAVSWAGNETGTMEVMLCLILGKP